MAKGSNRRRVYRGGDVALALLGQSRIARTSRGHRSHVRFWHHADSQYIVGVSIDSLYALYRYSACHLNYCFFRSNIGSPGFSVCSVGVRSVMRPRQENKLKLLASRPRGYKRPKPPGSTACAAQTPSASAWKTALANYI